MTIKKPIERNYLKLYPMRRFLTFAFLAVCLFSCNRNPLQINVSNVTVDLKIKHLDVDLLVVKPGELQQSVPLLKANYGEFFDIFTYRMIGIGGTEHESFYNDLQSFMTDTLIASLKKEVAEKIDTSAFREDVLMAFRHYKHYFPEKPVPEIYTCISGFNQSVVTAENLIGVSLDKYLGVNSRYYKDLGLPVYKRRNMHVEKMTPDMMYAWAFTEWPKTDNANNLLSHMIYEGKLMYFVDAMLPQLHDSLKIGFTREQLDFCKKGEATMWTYLAEHKLLFSTDRMDIKRFIDDGPYTSVFTDQSPARTGVWLGWQIVRSYMKENPEVKLADLMNDSNFQSILNNSGYQP